ncbi:unnamed protein product [Calypogeia fissa]
MPIALVSAASGSNTTIANYWAISIRTRLGKEVEGHASEPEESLSKRTIFRVPTSVTQCLVGKVSKNLYIPEQISLGLFHRPGRHTAPPRGEDVKLQVAGAFLISIYTKQCMALPEPNSSLEKLMCDKDFAQQFSGEDITKLPVAKIVEFLTAERRDRVWSDLCNHIVGRDEERSKHGIDKRPAARWKETVDCYDLKGDDAINLDEEQTEVLQSALTLDAIIVGSYISTLYCYRNGIDFPFPLVNSCTQQAVDCFDDFFKLENQIPLMLLERVLNVMWNDSREAQQILNGACAEVVAQIVEDFPGYDLNYHTAYVQDLQERKKFLGCDHLLGCAALVLKPTEETDTQDNGDQEGEEEDEDGERKELISSSNLEKGVFATPTLAIRRLQFVTISRYIQNSGIRSRHSRRRQTTTYTPINFPNATALLEAGIHVRGCSSPGFDLLPVFQQGWLTGTLQVPRLPVISSRTRLLWRNIAAYESRGYEESQICAFMTMMDCLVDSKEDVLLLMNGDNPVCQEGYSDSPEQLANEFNTMTKGLPYIGYGRWVAVSNQVNKYQNQEYRKMFLDFLRTNFGKPWLVISVAAATFLLVLSFLQTYYAILAYYL